MAHDPDEVPSLRVIRLNVQRRVLSRTSPLMTHEQRRQEFLKRRGIERAERTAAEVRSLPIGGALSETDLSSATRAEGLARPPRADQGHAGVRGERIPNPAFPARR